MTDMTVVIVLFKCQHKSCFIVQYYNIFFYYSLVTYYDADMSAVNQTFNFEDKQTEKLQKMLITTKQTFNILELLMKLLKDLKLLKM